MVRKHKGRCEVAVQRADIRRTASSKKVAFLGKPMTDVEGKIYDEKKLKDLRVRRKKYAAKRCKSW